MYLSRLLIDPTGPRAARTLARPYLLHQAVMAGFEPQERGESRVLYRVEPERPAGRVMLLVQSETGPDWDRAAERFFGVGLRADAKELRLTLAAEQRLRFRLRANPTVKRDGKRLGLYEEERQRAWLQRKLFGTGAALDQFRVIDEGRVVDRDPALELQSALFEGVLSVQNPEMLLDTVQQGIGSGKAFGFGMLSLAPAGGG
jgi:CRISPR system Cascade subunit CasE